MARLLAALIRWGRRPGLWITLLLVSAIFLMPAAGPLMRALFPDDSRPVYTRASFFELTLAHVELVALSSLAAAAIGISLGIFVTRERGREFAAMVSAIAAIGQTFPPVAVLALTIPVLGYGAAPAVAALCLYAIFPVIEATVTGLRAVPAAVRDAAMGMGFAPRGVLWRIRAAARVSFHSRRSSQCSHHQYRNRRDRIGRRRFIAGFARHRGTFRVEPGLCLGRRRHRRAARYGGGSLFRLARGIRAPRRNALEVITPASPAIGKETRHGDLPKALNHRCSDAVGDQFMHAEEILVVGPNAARQPSRRAGDILKLGN